MWVCKGNGVYPLRVMRIEAGSYVSQPWVRGADIAETRAIRWTIAMSEPLTTIFRAGAVRDAAPREVAPQGPVNLSPGAVAVCEGRIVAVGGWSEVERAVGRPVRLRVVDLPDRLILPAMTNAHAHLDLTDIGAVSYPSTGRDFIRWIEMVMRSRPRTQEQIETAVRNGLRMSRQSGVGMVGDIAGSETAVRARWCAAEEIRLPGCSYLECFGIGAGESAAAGQATLQRDRLWDELKPNPQGKNQIGLQPHAPYSAGIELFRAAGDPPFTAACSTHLAETPEEDQFVRHGSGPFVELLKRLGKWDESIKPMGHSPVEYLAPVLRTSRWVVAHCNEVSDRDIELLASAKAAVAYCPLASEYFEHAGHRYRDMLEAGVNVCIGTDSLICQPPHESQPLGVMPQLRRLYRRDRTDPGVLLAMATWRGEAALCGRPYAEVETIRVGCRAALAAVRFDPAVSTDALTQALLNDEPVEPLADAAAFL